MIDFENENGSRIWRSVRTNGTALYRLRADVGFNAFIEYTITDQDGAPVRLGVLQVSYAAGDALADVIDEADMMRPLSSDSTDVDAIYSPEREVGTVSFRFYPVDGFLVFQYRNTTLKTLSIRFKTSHPSVARDSGLFGNVRGKVVITSAITAKVRNDIAGAISGQVAITSEIFSLQAAQGGDGPLRIILRWFNLNDLDIHVVTPAGNEIYYRNGSADGGVLDVDANAGGNVSVLPVENVVWASTPPRGTYIVRLVHYATHDTTPVSDYVIDVQHSGQSHIFTGTLTAPDPSVQYPIYTFTL